MLFLLFTYREQFGNWSDNAEGIQKFKMTIWNTSSCNIGNKANLIWNNNQWLFDIKIIRKPKNIHLKKLSINWKHIFLIVFYWVITIYW